MCNIDSPLEIRDIQGNIPGRPILGRPISRSEVLRITAQILEQAERERLELASREAKQGIQYEV